MARFFFALVAISVCSVLFQHAALAASSASVELNDREKVVAALHAQHEEWAGTKYVLGGVGRDGIDCSGFVHITYQHRFGISLPRTTERLAEFGDVVGRDRLEPGDLVFFITDKKQSVRHVGIYVKDEVFLHASTSRGVMLSRMDNPYWKQNYWKAVRPHRDRQ